MNDPRQGDIFLFPILDGTGNIKIVDGEPIMDQGFETAVYISLEGDNGEGWFGNEYLEESQKIVSSFAAFRKGAPLTSASILTAEELIASDLQWLINEDAATDVNVSITIISRNMIEVNIEILIDDVKVPLSPYQLNWKAQEENPAHERG